MTEDQTAEVNRSGGGSGAWLPPANKITRWMLTRADSEDSPQLRVLLHEGWEPFAVSDGRVWLRQKMETYG